MTEINLVSELLLSTPVAGLVFWIMFQWVKQLQKDLDNEREKSEDLSKGRLEDLKASLVVLHSVDKTNITLVDAMDKMASEMPENTRKTIKPAIDEVHNEVKNASAAVVRIDARTERIESNQK